MRTPIELQLWYDMVRKSDPHMMNDNANTNLSSNDGTITGDCDESINEISITVPNIDVKEAQQNSETEPSNSQMSPLIPLITELGINK